MVTLDADPDVELPEVEAAKLLRTHRFARVRVLTVAKLKLVLNYFERPGQNRQTLGVLAGVLGFTAEERRCIGAAGQGEHAGSNAVIDHQHLHR